MCCSIPLHRSRSALSALPLISFLLVAEQFAFADDIPVKPAAAKVSPVGDKADGSPIPLNKNATVLLDRKGNRVLLKTHVALRQGALEMLCCLKQTKEHESILSLDAKAYVVHTALLALDAKPGKPVHFDTEYHPPTGQKIDIFLNWTDANGKSHRVSAKSWVRHAINRFRIAKMDRLPKGLKLPKNTELRYDNKLKELSWYGPMTVQQKVQFLVLGRGRAYREAIESFLLLPYDRQLKEPSWYALMTARQQADFLCLIDDQAYAAVVESFFEQSQPREMEADWVFAGSNIYKDEDTGKEFYLAEDGDLICVANFASATIDVASKSTAEDSGRDFEAWTDRIPPKDTPVTVELILVTAAAAAEKAGPNGPPAKK